MIFDFKKNSITIKFEGMRKPQDFVVYPFNESQDYWKIQSDTRIAQVFKNGDMILSKSRSNGSCFVDLSPLRGAIKIKAPQELMEFLNGLKPTGTSVRIV